MVITSARQLDNSTSSWCLLQHDDFLRRREGLYVKWLQIFTTGDEGYFVVAHGILQLLSYR